MTKPIKACHKCGSRNFSLKESSVYRAQVCLDGSLRVIDICDSETDSISCWDCLEPHSDQDFTEINFVC